MTQVVDPLVTRAKYTRELAAFQARSDDNRRRGVFLLAEAFPKLTVGFAAVRLKPAPLVAAVEIDFTDYDLRPPSVRFVDPIDGTMLAASDMRFAMMKLPSVNGMDRAAVVAAAGQGAIQPLPMIVAHGDGSPPFLCVPGTREYHDNPAHTGDSWLLHRGSGEGSLAVIVDMVWLYGSNPIHAYQVQVMAQAPVMMLGMSPALLP